MRLLVAVALITFSDRVDAQSTKSGEAIPLSVTEIAGGFDDPWAVATLPDGRFLMTERAGRLLLFPAVGTAGDPVVVSGLPDVVFEGQGGLLDVMVPRDFAISREIWLTYAGAVDGETVEGGAATTIGKGRLSADGTALQGFAAVYQGDPMPGGRHFGARLVEAADGSIFATTGDRGTGPDGMQAQDPARVEGKVIHLARDGSPATQRDGWRPGVYSLGHRNMQGAALTPEGDLLVVEHGAKGGDEVNLVRPGLNYGWPEISYGRNYNGRAIGEGTAKDGMEQPLHYWDPSIAPSGLMVYSGALFPDWAGDIFTGSLNSDYLSRLDPDTATETGFAEHRLIGPETQRVRDVIEAPDGAIWLISEGQGALYRLAPEGR